MYEILLETTFWLATAKEGIAPQHERPVKGTVMNHEPLIIKTDFPLDAGRFDGIRSPIVRRPVFAIRSRPKRNRSRERKSFIQMGHTDVGKTSATRRPSAPR
jgi:hypothetical protein